MKTILSLLLFCIGVPGISQQVLPLWPNEIPNQRASDEKEKTTQTERIIWIENVQNPLLEVYLPSKGNFKGKAVLIFPGGGYQGLAYDWEGTDIAKWLNSEGIAGIVVKYRLPVSKSIETRHLAPLQDAQRAIKTVRHHAEKWGITRIGIMGFSAGGHLASTLGTHFDKSAYTPIDEIDQMSARPDFMALIYPVISFSSNQHQGSQDNLLGENQSKELINLFSNELRVTSETPPTFLIHSSDDAAVPVENSLMFYQSLKNNNVPVEMHIYPFGGHGFSLALDDKYLHSWTDRFIDWVGNLQ